MRYIGLSFLMAIVLSCTAWVAQDDKKVLTPEEILAGYGIDLNTPSLIKALSSPEAAVRENSAIILGQRKEKAAAPKLRELLTDSYLDAKLAAADALMRMGDNSAKASVQEVLFQDKDYPAALKAAAILGNHSSDEGLPVVIRILSSRIAAMDKVQAVQVLATFSRFESHKDQVIKEIARVFTGDENLNVRRAAASELQNFPSAETNEAFQQAIRDRDPVIRGLAERYLKTKVKN